MCVYIKKSWESKDQLFQGTSFYSPFSLSLFTNKLFPFLNLHWNKLVYTKYFFLSLIQYITKVKFIYKMSMSI